MLEDDDYKELKALLDLASKSLQDAKRTLSDGPEHWAKTKIDEMLTSLNEEINVASTLVDESYVIVAVDELS